MVVVVVTVVFTLHRSVTAAELNFTGIIEREVGVHETAGEGGERSAAVRGGAVVVVEREKVGEGFSGELAAVEEVVKVEHEFAFGDAVAESDVEKTKDVPETFGDRRSSG